VWLINQRCDTKHLRKMRIRTTFTTSKRIETQF
jgi:hypothetical protein